METGVWMYIPCLSGLERYLISKVNLKWDVLYPWKKTQTTMMQRRLRCSECILESKHTPQVDQSTFHFKNLPALETFYNKINLYPYFWKYKDSDIIVLGECVAIWQAAASRRSHCCGTDGLILGICPLVSWAAPKSVGWGRWFCPSIPLFWDPTCTVASSFRRKMWTHSNEPKSPPNWSQGWNASAMKTAWRRESSRKTL